MKSVLWNVAENIWKEGLLKIIFSLLVVAGFVLFIATISERSVFRVSPSAGRLDIIAALIEPDPNDAIWTLRGRVLRDGIPLNNAIIWAILKDIKGNRDSPSPTKTDEMGSFMIESVPKTIAKNMVTEVTVYAQGSNLNASVKGEEVLVIGQGSLRRVKSSVGALLIPPAIFLLSLFVALWKQPGFWSYVISIFFAFALTVMTIAEISSGLSYVHTTGDKNEILSLGYASIFRGRYVKDMEPEWLFSLTAPRELARLPGSGSIGGTWSEENSAPPIVRGFGAPLWVLLLAVVGVGLSIIMLMVKAIGQPPDFNAPEEVCSRIEMFVRHQLYMLFAPLGAIFVYQFLVIAESATQPAAVALVSLGAGVTLTTLLERALAVASVTVPPSQQGTQRTGAGVVNDGQREQPPQPALPPQG
jgi:hypothetical protein